MDIIEKILSEIATVQLLIFTFLGASFNSMILDVLFLYFLGVRKLEIFQILVYVCLAFLFPVLYSLFISYLIPRKVIVPPLFIQISSIAIVNVWEYLRFSTEIFAYTILLFVFFVIILIVSWLVQDPITIKMVGLVGSKDDVHFSSYQLDEDYEKVKDIFLDDRVQKATLLEKKDVVNENGLWVFYRPAEITYQVFAFFAKSKRKKSVTILNILSYEKLRYGIKKSEESTLQANMITHLLRDFLDFAHAEISNEKPEYYYECINYVLKPTMRMRGIEIVMFFSTMFILVSPLLLRYMNIFDVTTVATSLLTILLTVVLFVWQSLRRKR